MTSRFSRRSTDLDPFLGDDAARELCEAISASNWDSAYKLYSANSSSSSRNLAFWSLDGSAEFPDLDERVRTTQQRDPMALLARGIHGILQAWDARGSQRAKHVKDQSWRLFFDRLGQADVDLHRASRLSPSDPVVWTGLLVSARGLQIPKEELDLRFSMLRKRDQDNYAGHEAYLQGIAGKWTGSDADMWDFAVAVHQAVPPGSPLHAIVAEAFVERFIISAEAGSDQYLPWLGAAADASIFNSAFARCEYIDRQHALTTFAQAFYFTKDRQRGGRAIELIGEHPAPDATMYVSNADEAGERWDTLCTALT